MVALHTSHVSLSLRNIQLVKQAACTNFMVPVQSQGVMRPLTADDSQQILQVSSIFFVVQFFLFFKC